jgi:hypothetical protein
MPSKKCVEEYRARGAMTWLYGVAIIAAVIILSI